jgi:hypothetical protein
MDLALGNCRLLEYTLQKSAVVAELLLYMNVCLSIQNGRRTHASQKLVTRV